MNKYRFILYIISFLLYSPHAWAPPAYVDFNFDKVEIGNLVKIVGEITGKRFVLSENLDKKVSVVTPEQIPASEVYPLFLSILESSGLTVVEKENALHIVALPEKTGMTAPVVTEGDEGTPVGFITKVIRLKHISAVALRKIIEPMVRGGKDGAALAFGPTNHLIITDTAESIRNIEKIIARLDKEGSSGIMEVIELQHISAEALARQLYQVMKGAENAGNRVAKHFQQVTSGGSALPGDFLVVPAEQANSIIVVGTSLQIADVKRLVGKLDIEAAAGRGRLNAIFLNYISAEDAAKSLNGLLAKTTKKDQAQDIAIEPSIANNALLVNAAPLDFKYISELVADLDRIPQQVLVEILIAEVAVNKNVDLGVEWSAIDTPKDGTTTVIGRSRPGPTDDILSLATEAIFPQGLSLGVARGFFTDANGNRIPRIPFLLRALANDRDVKILSNVPLWAQNNTEATVSVVQNIPILKSTIEGGSGTARDVIQNIERLDVGITLSITPLVNPNNEVTLKLHPTIEAIIDEGSSETQFTPTIAKREVSTTVTIPNKATVAISGLIREDIVEEDNRVPILSRIPLLGHLFRNKQDRKEKTNLLIFVTPHIVTDMAEAQKLKADWENKTNLAEPIKNLSFDKPDK